MEDATCIGYLCKLMGEWALRPCVCLWALLRAPNTGRSKTPEFEARFPMWRHAQRPLHNCASWRMALGPLASTGSA